jgi:23S rRNA (pseudouridine1915-N3)-methyltransferase
MKIDLVTIGRIKKGAHFDLCADYASRIKYPLTIHEGESKTNIESAQKADEEKYLLSKIPPDSYCVILDERGQSLKSIAFADFIEKLELQGQSKLCFVIGGATGLGDDIKKRANYSLSFGVQTWPHQLVRVMLLEQIYRAQQIRAGHPYHKE